MGSFFVWVGQFLHIAGILGLIAGLFLKFKKDSKGAPAAVFHSSVVMLVSGTLLIVANSWTGEHMTRNQMTLIGIKFMLLLVIGGLGFWLRRETTKPAKQATTVDGQTVALKAESQGGPMWAYQVISVALIMNIAMGLSVLAIG